MRLLVSGDREWPESDRDYLYAVLDHFHAKYHVEVVIEGEARGVDTQAREWAVARNIPFEPYPAHWDVFRRAAGAIRNRQMLREGKPGYVLAFHRRPWESRGTKDMVTIARKAGLTATWIPTYEEEPMTKKQAPQVDTSNLPGGVVPDRVAVPDPANAAARGGVVDAGRPGHKDTNTVAGLADPDAEAKAPGRTTHGATNNP